MSDRNPNFHDRRSIRLKGYDYSRTGLYFITLCVQNRENLFGEIVVESSAWADVGADVGAGLRARPETSIDNIYKGDHAGSPRQEPRQLMLLNDAGKMIEKWYAELESKYPNIRCHEMVVMPNHFHCIVEITDAVVLKNGDMDTVDSVKDNIVTNEQSISRYGPHNKKYHPVIGDVVGWFKTMTTNEYIQAVKNHGWKRFDGGKLWQRDYWEHIIRDEKSYCRISEYITQNPDKWGEDQLNAPE